MNTKSFLILGLLFSVGSIFADESTSGIVQLMSQVEDESTAPASKPSINNFYDEALQRFSVVAAQDILDGKDMSEVFSTIPEKFSDDKDRIFGYIIDAMRAAEEIDDRDVLVKVVAKRTLLEYQQDALLDGHPEPTRTEQVLAFGDRNKETFKKVGIVIGLVSLGYVLGNRGNTES